MAHEVKSVPPTAAIAERERVAGLDTLRFVAALWVVFSHFGFLPLEGVLDRHTAVGWFLHGAYGNLFAGPPAVMVFFVISGFCIHYPYRTLERLPVFSYLVRRYVRISIPMIVAMVAARPLEVNLRFFQNSILWSLVAELIYYSLYPMLRLAKTRFGWNKVIAVAYVLGFLTLLIHPGAKDYSPFGNGLNWLLGLPCWLLGCKLADELPARSETPIKCSVIWRWRLGVWGLSSVCSVLRFHSPAGYPWTLLILGGGVFFWLRAEIAFWRQRKGTVLEWAGQWSYSVYLIHLIAAAAFARVAMPDLGTYLNWFAKVVCVLTMSYVFYLLVEYPSHLLARWASRKLRKPRAGQPQAAVLSPAGADYPACKTATPDA